MKKLVMLVLCLGLIVSFIPAQQQETEIFANQVFDNLKDEYKLAGYFLTHLQKKYYKKLSDNDKWRYLQTFWKANDLDPTTEANEFLDQIRIRIKYCNQHFTHFNDGWTTDRGRIYIRNGEPYEVISQLTGVNAKYPQKDYEIWKYRISSYRTYIFFDQQQHGDHRLIYSENDPDEGSWSDWKSYLGTDFDVGLLY
ncbi:MAG: GWxTD domain-containing protein [Candidatus Cloacimonadales bacterium]|nr:GWxTD domain-containing protein [Candidatus Cloacimonadales bacterium]